jgi:hypothetical protein
LAKVVLMGTPTPSISCKVFETEQLDPDFESDRAKSPNFQRSMLQSLPNIGI